MKRFLPYAISLAFVLGVEVAFIVVWVAFLAVANPDLVDAILNHGVQQSRAHLLAVDSLQFVRNSSALFWWWIIAFIFFSWTDRKRVDRAMLRRVGIAVYLAPFVSITTLLLVAVWGQKMPNQTLEPTTMSVTDRAAARSAPATVAAHL